MITIDELDVLEHSKNHDFDYVDIDNIIIDPSLPINERLETYLHQIKNPYRFKSGSIVVSIEYLDNNNYLSNILKDYLTSKIDYR